jgi:hypothetical protein
MANQEELLKNLKKYKKTSLYRVARTRGEQRDNIGFDFADSIMERTTSTHLRRNENISTFMTFLSDYFANLIRAVKWVQIHRVYTVDKHYEYID